MIHLVTTDGYRDSLILDSYATNKSEIISIIRCFIKEYIGLEARNFNIDLKSKTVDFETRFEFEDDYCEWDKMRYHLVSITIKKPKVRKKDL